MGGGGNWEMGCRDYDSFYKGIGNWEMGIGNWGLVGRVRIHRLYNKTCLF